MCELTLRVNNWQELDAIVARLHGAQFEHIRAQLGDKPAQRANSGRAMAIARERWAARQAAQEPSAPAA